jgi:hypothetical protein
LNNENIISQIDIIPKFTTAHKLLEHKFTVKISKNKNNKKKRKIELTLGNKVLLLNLI